MSRDSFDFEKIKLLETFFVNSYDGIFITDNLGKVLLVNPAIENMLDTSYQELVDVHLDNILDKGIYVNSASQRVIETNKAFTGLTKVRNGVEIMSTSVPIFDEDNRLQLIITNCRPLATIEEFYRHYLSPVDKKTKIQPRENLLENDKQIIYQSQAMQNVMKKIQTVSNTDCTIVISGDTGTGKSLLAKYIHENSFRRHGKLIEINCSTIPENLMESELFGYEAGAFTGASARGKIGLFEVANNGTIFLDEIGEIPLHLQAKLLKFLDSGYIMRVGGTVYHKINTRVIAATNKNLRTLVAEGKFREDLYYRLNVIPIFIPPLKERKEDIPILAENIIEELNEKYRMTEKKVLDPQVIQSLTDYDWPGNVRQLKNALERLFISCFTKQIIDQEAEIFLDDEIYADVQANSYGKRTDESPMPHSSDATLTEHLLNAEKAYITHKLSSCGGNISAAAQCLGMHRTTLHKKIKEFELL